MSHADLPAPAAQLLEQLMAGPCRHPRHLLRALLGLERPASETWLCAEAALSLEEAGEHRPGEIDVRTGRVCLRQHRRTTTSLIVVVTVQGNRATDVLGEDLERLRDRMIGPRERDEAEGVRRMGLLVMASLQSMAPDAPTAPVLEPESLRRTFPGPEYQLPLDPPVSRLLLGHRLRHPQRKEVEVALSAVLIDRRQPTEDVMEQEAQWASLIAHEPPEEPSAPPEQLSFDELGGEPPAGPGPGRRGGAPRR
jgi:hypothetical protein